MDGLNLLDDIRIASPCDARWYDMPGDDRVRSCSACSRPVYNALATLVVSWAGSKPGESPRPSGPDVTWDDWVHRAAVSLGLRPAPTPTFTTVPMGDVF